MNIAGRKPLRSPAGDLHENDSEQIVRRQSERTGTDLSGMQRLGLGISFDRAVGINRAIVSFVHGLYRTLSSISPTGRSVTGRMLESKPRVLKFAAKYSARGLGVVLTLHCKPTGLPGYTS